MFSVSDEFNLLLNKTDSSVFKERVSEPRIDSNKSNLDEFSPKLTFKLSAEARAIKDKILDNSFKEMSNISDELNLLLNKTDSTVCAEIVSEPKTSKLELSSDTKLPSKYVPSKNDSSKRAKIGTYVVEAMARLSVIVISKLSDTTM
jgi:hypothetical protein